MFDKLPKKIKVASGYWFKIFIIGEDQGSQGSIDFQNQVILVRQFEDHKKTMIDFYASFIQLANADAMDCKYYLTKITRKQATGLARFLFPLLELNREQFLKRNCYK